MHNSAERHPPPKCRPGTRKKILAELTNWIEHPGQDSSIIWLKAPAGHGKSAILQSIAELLSFPRGRVVANFFFGRGKGKRAQAHYLFTTIAYQLAMYVPGLREHIDHIVSANPTLPTKAIEYQVETLIVGAFSALHTNEVPEIPFTVVIDGLDECLNASSQQLILELLGQMVTIHRLPLRFLVASRPEPHIHHTFKQPSLVEITYHLNLADDDLANPTIVSCVLVRRCTHSSLTSTVSSPP